MSGRSGAPTGSGAAATISRSSSSAIPPFEISVAIENYNWQHQDLRTQNAIPYGDTIDHVDFAYLAKMTKLNIAALAAIASAPPPPEPRVEGAVSTDTTLTWPLEKIPFYVIHWRRTDSSQWEFERRVRTDALNDVPGCKAGLVHPGQASVRCVLPHIRVDDWVFGVSAVSKDGFESPVASAVPGGAFHPYIAPVKKAGD